ncbi:type IV pilus twitching motility protein PilT [Paenibacillus protaetiae]|uniref:Type IV pilus twitching motility protein PilT n=1 Tax=Paenibacillus protaetiae TaxID=2509456 RepID=A0A4P6EU19_9BACL|nr:type IV pilus twitching motility protein PilT [Paenibacillus protaetiae]QAY66432.1 type IV pilus twitching motility protein PilT [Paenibacillus protaetiae]
MLVAEELMRAAYEAGASDVHLTVNSPVVFRWNGELRPYGGEVLKPADTSGLARQLMTDVQHERFISEGDIDFSYGIAGVARFRVNAYKQRGSVGLAIRIVPSRIPTMQELMLPGIAYDFTGKPQGLVLVTGPTGSGKSTTLASMINHMNDTRSAHIITLEDPIEFIYDHRLSMVNQREIGLDTMSFASGLRSALRQDPDVVLLGEMRDLETIGTAISAAETGHLVLATLHTADAPQTIDRIVDVFPPGMQAQIRVQLSAVLLGVISQRLIPCLDGNGRTAAFEVLVNTPAVANLIRSEKIYQLRSVMQTSRAQGMQTMSYHLNELVREGRISKQAAKEAMFGFPDLQQL